MHPVEWPHMHSRLSSTHDAIHTDMSYSIVRTVLPSSNAVPSLWMQPRNVSTGLGELISTSLLMSPHHRARFSSGPAMLESSTYTSTRNLKPYARTMTANCRYVRIIGSLVASQCVVPNAHLTRGGRIVPFLRSQLGPRV